MIDINTLKELMITALWASPLVLAVVEAVKRTFPDIDKRYLPAVSALIGIVVALLVIDLSIIGAVVGLMLGLSSTGLYEIGKNTLVK